MFKLSLWSSTGAAVISAILLLTPETSDAQWRGYGARRGGDWGRSWYNTGRYYGYGYPSYYRGGYYYPNYEAGVYVTPNYTITPEAYQSNYLNVPYANSAAIMVRVPNANAEVWFEDQRTQQRGRLRQFTSGSLEPNHDYVYHIRARWIDNTGQQAEQSRNVTFRAGQQVTVDFSAPSREQIPTNPTQGQFSPND